MSESDHVIRFERTIEVTSDKRSGLGDRFAAAIRILFRGHERKYVVIVTSQEYADFISAIRSTVIDIGHEYEVMVSKRGK